MTFTDVLIGIGAMINHYRDKKRSDIVKALTLMHEEALNDVSDYAHDHVIAGIEVMLTAIEQKQRKLSDSQQLLCLKERIMARLDRGCGISDLIPTRDSTSKSGATGDRKASSDVTVCNSTLCPDFVKG